MSVEAIKAVWQIPIQPAGRKLVMLNLADCQNATTKLINPSVSVIAKACNLTPSQVKRHLTALKDAGLVSVTANKFGGNPGATPHYRLNLQIPFDDARGSVDATGSADATGSVDAQEGAHPCTGGVAPMLPKPERTGRNRKEREQDKPATRSKGKSLTFAKWSEVERAEGRSLIADWKPLAAYQASTGLPDELVQMAWIAFKDRYTNSTNYRAKKYTDWRDVFLNAIKGNWLNLWFMRDDIYELTTVGKQAERAQATEVTG